VLGVDVNLKKVVTNFATVAGPKVPLSIDLSQEKGGKGGIWQGGLGLSTDGNRIFFAPVRWKLSHYQPLHYVLTLDTGQWSRPRE